MLFFVLVFFLLFPPCPLLLALLGIFFLDVLLWNSRFSFDLVHDLVGKHLEAELYRVGLVPGPNEDVGFATYLVFGLSDSDLVNRPQIISL